jgi:predicted metal-dependent hydrolase
MKLSDTYKDPPKSPLKRGTLNSVSPLQQETSTPVPPFLRGARGDLPKCLHSDHNSDIHSVPYGSRRILFSLEYSPRKTLAIEVHPDSSVIVKAPETASLEAIETKVSHRASWITKQQHQFAQYAPQLPASEYISGEGYRYLGRQYRLKAIESDREQVRLWQGKLEVRTPDANNSKQIEKAIDKWYRDRALTVFLERYEYCLQLVAPYGINPDREASQNERGFELRTMKKRWGSCTKAGKILINPLLVSAPKDCIDYVIVHELCHLRIHNHSQHFYQLLETIMPDWKTRKDYLNHRIELRSRSDSAGVSCSDSAGVSPLPKLLGNTQSISPDVYRLIDS